MPDLDTLLHDLALDAPSSEVPLKLLHRRASQLRRRRMALASTGPVAAAAIVAGVVLAGMGDHGGATVQSGGPTTVTIRSGAMERTLVVGQTVTVVPDTNPRRQEIIAFHSGTACAGAPGGSCSWNADGGILVKRVIAIGGDTVACPATPDNPDFCAHVVVNGTPLDEPYVYEDDNRVFPPVTVPPGRLYVLGDHRGNSSDSRSNGTIAVSSVLGRVILP